MVSQILDIIEIGVLHESSASIIFLIFMGNIRVFSYFIANVNIPLKIKIAVMKAKHFFLLSRIFYCLVVLTII